MDQLKKNVIDRLQESRRELLEITKSELTGDRISIWYEKWRPVMRQSDTISDNLLPINISYKMQGFWHEKNTDVCLNLRTIIIELVDKSIKNTDAKQNIRPILDDFIAKVSDTKLSTLLREFNDIRTNQPNIACMGFRTILPLIIRERAKKVDPKHKLATKDDISFESDIKAAVSHKTLFNSAEKKLIKRYLSGGKKDSFDNVTHKPDTLVDKDDLEDAIDLLNNLLPSIINKSSN